VGQEAAVEVGSAPDDAAAVGVHDAGSGLLTG
jgi:hypothetical protein